MLINIGEFYTSIKRYVMLTLCQKISCIAQRQMRRVTVPDHGVKVVSGKLELRDGEEGHEVAWVIVIISCCNII